MQVLDALPQGTYSRPTAHNSALFSICQGTGRPPLSSSSASLITSANKTCHCPCCGRSRCQWGRILQRQCGGWMCRKNKRALYSVFLIWFFLFSKMSRAGGYWFLDFQFLYTSATKRDANLGTITSPQQDTHRNWEQVFMIHIATR